MAPRPIKLSEQDDAMDHKENQLPSQQKRAEFRYLLQVDRQTKGSYPSMESAEAAGLLIKKHHPVVQVSIYDSVETSNKLLSVPARSGDA